MAGGSDGIGAAFARQLAASGLGVVLLARCQEPLQALAEELQARDADVVQYAQLFSSVADMCRILESGKDRVALTGFATKVLEETVARPNPDPTLPRAL